MNGLIAGPGERRIGTETGTGTGTGTGMETGTGTGQEQGCTWAYLTLSLLGVRISGFGLAFRLRHLGEAGLGLGNLLGLALLDIIGPIICVCRLVLPCGHLWE